MPDLYGNSERHDLASGAASDMFRRLASELLRAIPRGDDSEDRVYDALVQLSKYTNTATFPLHDVIASSLQEIHRKAFPDDRFEGKYSAIIKDCLHLAAESFARDPNRANRKASRGTALAETIEHYLMEKERAARDRGQFSYLAELAKRADWLFGKWQAKKRSGTDESDFVI
jgi:hypothetical protein